MITIKTNLDEVVKEFKQYINKKEAQINQIAVLTPRQVGKVIKDEIISVMREENMVASSSLLRSVSVTGLRASTNMSEAFVGSSSPYAKFVEEGVNPGGKMPPTAKIYRWMIQKGMDASESGAYLIARKIARDGIPAKRPFQRGAERADAKIEHELNIILKKTLTKD